VGCIDKSIEYTSVGTAVGAFSASDDEVFLRVGALVGVNVKGKPLLSGAVEGMYVLGLISVGANDGLTVVG
jgi:hypothetical protein